MRRVSPLLLAILLSACASADITTAPISTSPPLASDTPAPTEIRTPTVAVALTEHPEPTQMATIVTPSPAPTIPVSTVVVLEENARDFISPSWSPDGRWILYFVMLESESDLSITPTFFEVATGRTCTADTHYAAWLPDNRVMLMQDGNPFVGYPCESFQRGSDSLAPQRIETVSVLSLDGRYRAETTYDDEQNRAVTTLGVVADGEVVNQVEWDRNGMMEHQGAGGQWLGSHGFLIWYTDSQNPIFITTEQDRVLDVPRDLFNFDRAGTNVIHSEAYGHYDAASDTYHILLTRMTPDGFRPLMLYHSETNAVETLDFCIDAPLRVGDDYTHGFSPDGNWLLLQCPSVETQPDDYTRSWIRRVDEQDKEAVSIGQVDNMVWSGPTQFIAYNPRVDGLYLTSEILIATFPEMQLIARWYIEDVALHPLIWSPDGTQLLALGTSLEYSDVNSLYLLTP